MSHLTKQGDYREGDIGPTDKPCQARPDFDHKLLDDPQDRLNNPMACWEPKSPTDIDAEKEASANTDLDRDTLIKLMVLVHLVCI